MKMITVDSSNVESHGYDEENKTLAVKFKNNDKTYHYPGFLKEKYEGLKTAKSIGSFVAQHVKGLKFHIK